MSVETFLNRAQCVEHLAEGVTLFLCKQIAAKGAEYERAARCPTLYPPDFNDFGEPIPSSAEDAA